MTPPDHPPVSWPPVAPTPTGSATCVPSYLCKVILNYEVCLDFKSEEVLCHSREWKANIVFLQ